MLIYFRGEVLQKKTFLSKFSGSKVRSMGLKRSQFMCACTGCLKKKV